MKRALVFALAFSCLALGHSRSSIAQDNATQATVSLSTESGSREQDKLNGPVRRVRVETAKILPKNGNWVEGPREALGIMTYDPAGRKIDSVVYPVERNSLSGKEKYTYDQKGNVVEKILLGTDGSLLSKESYAYEFDQLGNWTKMSSSVAVYENGKIVFEPTGITYRTISYYYSQAIEKLNAPSPKSRGVSAPNSSSTLLANSTASPTASAPLTTPNGPVSPTSQPRSVAANAHATTERVNSPALVSPAKSAVAASESPVATSNETRSTPDVVVPEASVVQHVTEEELRGAALELPKPEYPNAALQAHANGKVEVFVLVDETGSVTTAQATSGHPLLGASAEAAARKARFSLGKVSSGATKVYGVISYDFELPKPPGEMTNAASPTVERAPTQPDNRKSDVRAVPETAAPVESKPKGLTSYLESARASYNKGVNFQVTGRYAEAAEAFNQAIKVDPNDARAYSGLAMAYSAMQKHKDAIIVYKMATQIDKSAIDAPTYYMWGNSYLALEKPSEALSVFKQALYITRAEAVDPEQKQSQRYPSLEQLHYGLGIAYVNLRRFGNSIEELKQVVKLNPKNAAAHYALAIAYFSNGNRREAEDHQKILRSLDPALAKKIDSAFIIPEPPGGCRTVFCR